MTPEQFIVDTVTWAVVGPTPTTREILGRLPDLPHCSSRSHAEKAKGYTPKVIDKACERQVAVSRTLGEQEVERYQSR